MDSSGAETAFLGGGHCSYSRHGCQLPQLDGRRREEETVGVWQRMADRTPVTCSWVVEGADC